VSDPFLSEHWAKHAPPAPAVVIVSSVMFLAGLLGAGVALLADRVAQRVLTGRWR